MRLSHFEGPVPARQLAKRLLQVKERIGRIYINQCKVFFAPFEASTGWYYRFLGSLGTDSWFPVPT